MRWTAVGAEMLTDARLRTMMKALLDDWQAHKSIWDLFFSLDDANVVWCERSVGVINTYATVLRRASAEVQERQRSGAGPDESLGPLVRESERVLNLGGLQLRRFKCMVEAQAKTAATAAVAAGAGGCHDPVEVAQSWRCLKGLTYRFLLIKHNLLCMTGRVGSQNPKELRFMSEWELEEFGDEASKVGGDDDRLQLASFIMSFLHKPLTRAALDATQDKELRHVFKVLLPQYLQAKEPEKFTRLYQTCVRFCGECGVFEELDEKFSRCSKCGVEFYCSKSCQVRGWKGHKLVCSAKS